MRALGQSSCIIVLSAAILMAMVPARRVEGMQQAGGTQSVERVSDSNPSISLQDLQRLAAEAAANRSLDPPKPDPSSLSRGSINFLKLLVDGGALMIPIAIMSLLVVAVAVERTFGLRSSRIFPRAIRREVRNAVDSGDGVSPQSLFDLARRHPSAASRVLQTALQKIGRPIPEIESAISEGTQREADSLYSNVRWLTLAAAVTPLIGLLGTVWGMIIAFYNTTQLGSGSNKAEFLAEGIYVALVTTLGGLAVAIPAAIFAHYFEGRITRLLGQIESEYRGLVPRFESLEGKTRYDLSARGLTRRVVSEQPKGGGDEALRVETQTPNPSSASRA